MFVKERSYRSIKKGETGEMEMLFINSNDVVKLINQSLVTIIA